MAIKREAIGWDIEDMPFTSNLNVESSRNVLGSNSVLTTSGVKTTALDPIKFNSAHNFSKFLQIAGMVGLETDKVKRNFTVVSENMLYGDTKETAKPFAYRDTADVEVSDMATGNQALQATATLHWNGIPEFSTLDVTATNATLEKITDFDPSDFTKFYFVDGIAERKAFKLFFEHEENEFN